MKKMFRKLPAVAGLVLAALAATAQAATLDFENIAPPGGSYATSSTNLLHSGYLVYGTWAAVVSSTYPDATLFGPGSTSDFFSVCLCTADKSLTLSRADGQLFNLHAFDAGPGQGSSFDLHIEAVKQDFSKVSYDISFSYSQWSKVLLDPLLGFTNLRSATISGNGPVALGVDNIVVSEVPVPAAAWLFGSGLLGLAHAGRRRASRG